LTILSTPPRAKSFVLRTTRRNGERINAVEGLRLHCPVIGVAEEAALIAWVDTLIADGRRGALGGTTYLEPKRWRKGLGRLTVQFGCSYSYMDHRIEVEQAVERMPKVLTDLIERLRRWGVVKRGREPDSAIINIYECDDAISPHIDDHAFVRPFYTVSMVRASGRVAPIYHPLSRCLARSRGPRSHLHLRPSLAHFPRFAAFSLLRGASSLSNPSCSVSG
jgi:hypothetical protein